MSVKYKKTASVWVTDFGWPDISLGVHICVAGRVDFHILKWMVSLGNVPIYEDAKGKLFAASNSYHEFREELKSKRTTRREPAFRAGVPPIDTHPNKP